MARVSGATVLLMLFATVSVYTCAILAGAALGRTLDRLPTAKQPAADSTLQVSVGVSFRGLAEDFAKELWGGDHRQGRSVGGARPGPGDRAAAAAALPSSAAHASVPLSKDELQYRQRQIMVQQIEAIRRENSRGGGMASTEQQTARQELWGGHHTEERPGTGAGDGAASAADRQIAMRQNEAIRRQMSRYSNFSGEITEGRRQVGGVVKVGPWGGSGGQAFYMRGGASAPRLLSVTLYHADAVHAFSFEFLQGGARRTMGPSGGHYYGSKGLRATINFSSDERLTAVEGTYGRCRSVPEVVVTSLTFRTDKGRTYGPYGEETGTPFSIPAANGCIVGFWGRSGWLLDAIGVYIMPCQAYNHMATS